MRISDPQLMPPPAKPRWCDFAADRFLTALLAVEGLLLLSERFRWPALDKGHTVVIAVVAVGVALFVMLLYFVASLLFGWHFRFTIRSLLLLIVVIAVVCGWLANEARWANKQRETLKEIDRWEYAGHGYKLDQGDSLTYLLRGMLGDDFFASVPWLYLGGPQAEDAALAHVHELSQLRRLTLDYAQITDAGLEHLKELAQLDQLDLLHCPKVSDFGLEHLKRLSRLRELALYGTPVTDEGVRKIQQALPNCRIER
jgi:hypothetical protein